MPATGAHPRQDLQSLLPAPEVRELTLGQPADQALIKQLLSTLFMTCAVTTPVFATGSGCPAASMSSASATPSGANWCPCKLKGPFADDRLARLGFAVSEQ